MLGIDPDILTKAWDGDAAAQLKLGKAFYSAVRTENNCLDAFKWIFQSAEQGDMEAQFRLGDLYALGHGTQKSLENAYLWYTKAALQGYKKALIRIHNLYQEDKKMYCRGQLNSDEEEWASDKFKKKNNIRELNEYRRELQAAILNNAVDYYTDQFKNYKSLNQKDVEVQLYLAFFYQHGYGIRKNTLLAIDFYTRAAEQGHRDAQYNLGCLYQYKKRIKFNYRLALRWYRVSATSGNIAAQNCLGNFYEKGLATDLNYEGAIYWYTRAANFGYSSAQLTLGRLYRKGQGVQQDLSEATKWYKLATNQKNATEQNCLNQMYLEGIPPKTANTNTISEHIIKSPTTFSLRNKLQSDITRLRDSPQFKQMKKLAQHALRTDGNAMFQIGLKYYNGEDFSQDKDAGFQWIKKAGKAGLQEVELKIADMYEEGDAVDQDYHQSATWTKKGVKKRNANARYKLGLLYKKGLGVRKDSLEASKWFFLSSDQGNNDAEYQFGLLKYHGEGLLQDGKIALKWFQLAILHGNTDALYEVAKALEKEKTRHRILKTHESTVVIVVTNRSKQTYRLIITWKESKYMAFLMYNFAAYFENKNAQFRLGEIYQEGKITKQDREKSHEYYIKAANSGDPFYQTELAIKYINGDFNDTEYRNAFDLLKKAASKKETRATGLFATPMRWIDGINDSSNVIDMFTSAFLNGIEGIDYNLGHVYEHGITINDKKVFVGDYANSELWYSRAAEKGDSKAQYELGVIYEEGKGVKVDFISAVKYYKQAYKNGNSDAAYSLGLMYLNGKSLPRDLIESFNLFSEASNMGHKKAYEKLMPSSEDNILEMLEAVAGLGFAAIQYQLGIFYENKNNQKSFKWFTLAIQAQISDAYYRLGVLYEEGRGTSRDYSKAIYFYKQAVSNDHEDAMYRLGYLYLCGLGSKCKLESAFNLYTKAAKMGHCLSRKMLNIAREHILDTHKKAENERSITSFKDKNTNNLHFSNSLAFEYSLKMFKYVAEQGNIQAQYTIGAVYENTFSKPNYPEAVKWYTMAAENLHGISMYRLGLFYEKGLGVDQSFQNAVQLYEGAYTQGNYDALFRLAVAYHFGTGVNINPEKAIQYYTKAAKHGQYDAQYTLGVLYERGELFQQNILKALEWYTISYSRGNDEAKQRLFSMYVDMPLENFFHQRLYNILYSALRYNNAYKYQADSETYGYLYYRLGHLNLNGIGAQRNYNRAWEYITTSVRKYKFKDVLRLLELDSIEKVEVETKEADDGNEDARYNVGKYHFNQVAQERIRQQGGKNANIINDTTESNDDSAISYHSKKAIHYFSLAASNGHRGSQFYLGKIYQNGYGTAIDYEQAKSWYIESSERKHRGARHALGMLYLNEPVIGEDYLAALMNLDIAAQEGNEDSSFQLGWIYEHGIGVDKDKEEAYKYFEKTSKHMQNTSEMNDYVEDSSNISDTTIDQTDDIDYRNKLDGISLTDLQKFSDKGNNEASYILHQKYLNGIGIEKDLSKSISCLRKAALQGHSLSQEKMALSYYYGTNVVKDIRMATMWLRAAVKKKNNKLSMLHLGQIYHCGLIDKLDFSDAFALYKAVDGIYRAVTLQGIGLLYEYGDLFKTNHTLALRYYIESFKKGNTLSGYNVALMYFHGKGVKQDYQESIHWLEKALQKSTYKDLPYVFIKEEHNLVATIEDQQNGKYSVIFYDTFVSEINYLLGRIYYEGLGVQEDTNRSFEYFSNANKNGKVEAKVQLAEIEEARRQLKKIEDDKNAFIKAKSQLEKTVQSAKAKLKKIEEDKMKIRSLEKMKIKSSKIEETKSLPIKETESRLEQEIEKAESLSGKSEVDKNVTDEFEDAKSRLEKIIEEVQQQLKVTSVAASVLDEINKAKEKLKEKIREAQVQFRKFEEAEVQFKKFEEYKFQSSKIEAAICLEEETKKMKLRLKNQIINSKNQLNVTGEVGALLRGIKANKLRLREMVDNNETPLEKIEEAKSELKKIEESEKKLKNTSSD